MTAGASPGSSSSLSRQQEFGLNTDAVDLNSFWYGPLSLYGVLAPFSQKTSSPSARVMTDERPAMAQPVVPRRTAHQGGHTDRFVVIGRWRGWVTAVFDETFLSEVEDLRWGSPPHEVELPNALISEFDQALLSEDSIFYWTVGYRHRPGGTRIQEARVRFRRAPGQEPWAERTGRAWAQCVRRALDEDPDD